MTARPRPTQILFAIIVTCHIAAASPAIGSAFELKGHGYMARFSAGRFLYYSQGATSPDMTYTLASVRLGDRRVSFERSPAVVAARNAVACYYPDGISESYTALPTGIEQCWVINVRPRSPGGIVIEGHLRSPHKATSSLSGLSFLGERGRRVLRYGAVTVIDSRNRTFRCLPKLHRGRLTISIPASYVRSAEFPILVDPAVGPEVQIGPTFGPAPGVQENLEVASGPGGSLAVWQDARSGADLDIFASRISSTGDVLDKMGVAVSVASGDQTDPAVAWNGQEYLVVWSDKRSGPQHIYGARVRPTGEVIDKQGLLLSSADGAQAYPRVASDGYGWLVVWQDSRMSSYDIYGRRVSSSGPEPIYGIATRVDNEESPDVAWNGATYIVVWRDSRNVITTSNDIYGCRVARNGIRLAGDIIVSCDAAGASGAPGMQRNPRVCSFGTTCLVAWEDFRNDVNNPDIYATRVSSTGSVLNKGGIAVCTAPGAQEFPAVSYNGSRLLVAWRDRNDRLVKGARLNTSGVVLDPNGIVLSQTMSGASGIATCSASSTFVVAWAYLDPTEADGVVSLMTDGGSVTNWGTVVTMGLNSEREYAVADNGTEYAVVWSQRVNGSWDILAARFSRSGQLLTPTPVNLTAGFAGNQTQPSIAWNGSKYLVAWSGDEAYPSTSWDIRGCRMQSNLTRIDSSPIAICGAMEEQTRPYAASNGSNFLVVWEDSRNAVSPYYYTDIWGATVDTNGAVYQIGSGISAATGDQFNPRVASDGVNYFVVWEDYRAAYPAIFGARVSFAGQVLDAGGIAFPATSYYQLTPAVCYGGGAYFVAWGEYYKIMGCRVATGGSMLDPGGIRINSGSTAKACPAACWDGSKYQVVWEDYRSMYVGNADVYHTTVSSAGQVSPYAETALASDLTAQLRPRIFASGSAGMLFYSRYDSFSNCVCAATLTEQLPQEVPSIAEAKHLPAGTLVSVRGKIVSGAFPGFFYVQEADRSSGIKVVSGLHVAVGDVVDVMGAMSVSDGERQLSADMFTAMGVAADPPRPLGMRGDAAGGGPFNGYTPGITGACGVNNIGLLIRTWGKVTSSGSDYFIIESRPMVTIKVKCGTLLQPAVGKIVAVTGISSCEVVSGAIFRALLPRTQADIRVMN